MFGEICSRIWPPEKQQAPVPPVKAKVAARVPSGGDPLDRAGGSLDPFAARKRIVGGAGPEHVSQRVERSFHLGRRRLRDPGNGRDAALPVFLIAFPDHFAQQVDFPRVHHQAEPGKRPQPVRQAGGVRVQVADQDPPDRTPFDAGAFQGAFQRREAGAGVDARVNQKPAFPEMREIDVHHAEGERKRQFHQMHAGNRLAAVSANLQIRGQIPV
jgi:hypothetical protein